MRFFDGGTKKKSNKNDAIMGKQIAEDDASLKVFMQAWNMLDTFEGRLPHLSCFSPFPLSLFGANMLMSAEHLAVHIELDEAEAQRQQMAKEVPPVEAAPQQPFDPSTQLVDLSFNSPSFPFDSPAMGANRHLLPPDLVPPSYARRYSRRCNPQFTFHQFFPSPHARGKNKTTGQLSKHFLQAEHT